MKNETIYGRLAILSRSYSYTMAKNYVKIFYLGGLFSYRCVSRVWVMQSDINYIFLFRNALKTKKNDCSDEIFRADMKGC